MALVADTSIWVDHLRGIASPKRELLRRELETGTLLIPDLVAYELLRGIRDDRRHAGARRDLVRYGLTPATSPAISLLAVDHYRALRALGISIRSAIDCLIAAYCIAHGHELLHNDRDYLPFEQHLGLRTPVVSSELGEA